MPAQPWIKTALKDRGLKLKDVAATLLIPPPRVTDIVQGRREVQADEIVPLARLLNLSTKSLLASLEATDLVDLGDEDAVAYMPLVGAITGGGVVAELSDDYPFKRLPVPPDARGDAGLQCYVMGDDSLNQEIPKGSLLIVGDQTAYSYAIVPGSYYLIRMPSGGLTIRQLIQNDSGDKWMAPRPITPNPAFASFPYSHLSADLDPHKPDGFVVRPDDVAGRVMWVHQRFAPQ